MPSNGQYQPSDLVVIAPNLGWPSGYGQARLKRNHDAMVAQMAAKGFSGSVNEIYRDLARQVYYRNLYLQGKGNPAAIPGTSKHGEGLAEDWNSPMTSWTSAMQLFWLSMENACGYSSAQGRADGESWHKVSVAEPSASVAGGGSVPIPNTLKGDDMKLQWDTGGTGWLVLDAGWIGLGSMQIYNLFKRVINSNQASDRPDTFNRAEVDMMNSVQHACYIGVVGGPTTPVTFDSAKLADAVATALAAKGIKATIDPADTNFAKALDAGFVRSLTAYANAAASATKGTVNYDQAKLADAISQSLQKTGVVSTVDTSAVTQAVLDAMSRATAAIGKQLQTSVS
jgi:hypothetical protein